MPTPPNYSLAAPARRPEILALAQDLNSTPSGEEYEKMISGMMYDPTVPALLEARHLARGLTAAYNSLDTTTVPFDKVGEVRLDLLRKLVGKAGDKTFVEPPFRPDYGCNISFGREVFVNFGLTVLDTSLVVIGDRVQIASNVSIIAASHDPSVLSRRRGVEFGHPVFIGDDCWIGANTVILPGVTIGQGSTIGAGSVVTRDVPPYSVAFGSPCRVRRVLVTAEEEEMDEENPYRGMFV